MAKKTLISDLTKPQEDFENLTKEIENIDSLLDEKLLLENKKLINNIVELFDNFDSSYWSLFISENKSLVFKIGNYKVVEISSNFVSLLIDSITLNSYDYKYLLQSLEEEQKDVYKEEFDGLLQVFISSEINEDEQQTLYSAHNIALSKIFGSTFSEPTEKSDPLLLEHFGFSLNEETNITDIHDSKEVDEKLVGLLSGEKSTIEYKSSIYDLTSGQKMFGSIMFDMGIKTIAGFANSKTGGSLLIGVEDNQFNQDTNLHLVRPKFIKQVNNSFKGEDNFLVRLGTDLKNIFDKVFLSTLNMDFVEVEQYGEKVKFLHIFVPSYSKPVFVKFTCKNVENNPYGTSNELFFVRFAHNSTENLSFTETISFISQRFEGYLESLA